MRFTAAWSELLTQNSVLKLLLLALILLCMVLSGGLLMISEKDPIVIERACHSRIVGLAGTSQTNAEVKAFLAEALEQRYDSAFDAPATFLSAEEKAKSQKERDDFGTKKIRQRVLINSIDVKKEKITVDADRIIAVESVRTAFHFPLDVKVGTVSRSERNPYGLILISVSEIKIKANK